MGFQSMSRKGPLNQHDHPHAYFGLLIEWVRVGVWGALAPHHTLRGVIGGSVWVGVEVTL
jgi:hypothetical protein